MSSQFESTIVYDKSEDEEKISHIVKLTNKLEYYKYKIQLEENCPTDHLTLDEYDSYCNRLDIMVDHLSVIYKKIEIEQEI
jgi:hypothetical protein